MGRAPDNWHGGRMAPVPKVAHLRLSLTNARAILRADVCGKIYAKVLRQQTAGTLADAAQDFQMGSVAAKGTDNPSFAVRLWLER